MNTFLRIIGVFVLGFCLVGPSAAFTLPGSETYLGYIGNLHAPVIKNAGGAVPNNGTDWISQSGSSNTDMVDNGFDSFTYPVSPATVAVTTHWYKFSLDTPAKLLDYIELGRHADMTISFFHETATYGDIPFETIIRNDNHDFQLTSPLAFAAGDWWMRLVGTVSFGEESNYTVRLTQVPVPLPPAILLFASALAGFGVMGRKRRQRLAS